MKLRYVCPACETKLASIEAMDSATQVVKRTCRRKQCGKQWQVIVGVMKPGNGLQFNTANFVEITK